MKNILLLFGGKSCEHDISIITAMQIKNNIDTLKYKVFSIYINGQNKWYLANKYNNPSQFLSFDEKKHEQVYIMSGDNVLYSKKFFKNKVAKIDCAIISCHGMNGEDGTIQGLLELSNIPYTSCSHTSSAINMDKVFQKQIFEINNLPITNYYYFLKEDFENSQKIVLSQIEDNCNYPVIVKPANLGSSIGISKCSTRLELIRAVEIALKYDKKVIVEEIVDHLKEINCACLGFREIIVSELEQQKIWLDFLTFDDKYLHFNKGKNSNKYKLDIPQKIQTQIKNISEIAFKKLDCSGVVRIDFLYNSDTEELFINEINTIPGSFANYLFKDISFSQLIDKLIEIAEQKFNDKNSFSYTFDSKVLKKVQEQTHKLKLSK